MDRQHKGKMGEELAWRAYEKQGYELVGRNYRCPWGEIDLIVKNGLYFVFCEVKLRSGLSYGGALFAVTPAKKRKLIKSAGQFMADNPAYPALQDLQPRFDVFCVQIQKKYDKILLQSVELIENAFEVKEESHDWIF